MDKTWQHLSRGLLLVLISICMIPGIIVCGLLQAANVFPHGAPWAALLCLLAYLAGMVWCARVPDVRIRGFALGSVVCFFSAYAVLTMFDHIPLPWPRWGHRIQLAIRVGTSYTAMVGVQGFHLLLLARTAEMFGDLQLRRWCRILMVVLLGWLGLYWGYVGLEIGADVYNIDTGAELMYKFGFVIVGVLLTTPVVVMGLVTYFLIRARGEVLRYNERIEEHHDRRR